MGFEEVVFEVIDDFEEIDSDRSIGTTSSDNLFTRVRQRISRVFQKDKKPTLLSRELVKR